RAGAGDPTAHRGVRPAGRHRFRGAVPQAAVVTAVPPGTVVELNGLRIHYLDWGRPSAAPVVCVHGYTSSAQAFNAPARHFQDRLRLIAPDVRGHGESAWSPAGAYPYQDQVGDLAALVDALALD